MKNFRLHKYEKLCSEKAIAALFSSSGDASSAIAYPLRAVWRRNDGRAVTCPQFVIVVPKKRLRRAVDRVTMRRRVREAYRLNREAIPGDCPLDISFIYVADTLKDYHRVSSAMTRLLEKINNSLRPVDNEEHK